MQIKEIAKSGLKHEFSIIVPASDIAAKTDAELQTIGKTVKMAGFRPGHIPAKILKQRYGKSVLGEVLDKTVQDAVQKTVKEKNLRPAMQPDLKIVSFDEGKDLEFTMTVEVLPEVPEISLDSIEVIKPTYEIPAQELEDGISRLADRNKSRTAKADSAKAEKGDVVKIDFKGLRDGVAFDGGTAEGFNLELGSGQFIPGFEDQLIGTKKGDEVNVEVSFPENYHNADLAGAPVVFEVKVHEVLATEAPKLDDEFAKGMGFEGIQALRDAVKSHLSKDYDSFARNHMKKNLFDQLENLCTFEVPEGMVDAEFKGIWQKLKQAQKEGDASVSGKSDEELEKEYRAIATRRVRLGIFLAELGRKANVQVSQQELMQAVFEQARMFPGQERKVVEFYQKNPDNVEELRGPLYEDKVVDYILSKVKTSEKPVTLEELANMEFGAEGEAAASEQKPAKKKAAAKKESADEAEASEDTAEKKPAKKKTTKSTSEGE